MIVGHWSTREVLDQCQVAAEGEGERSLGGPSIGNGKNLTPELPTSIRFLARAGLESGGCSCGCPVLSLLCSNFALTVTPASKCDFPSEAEIVPVYLTRLSEKVIGPCRFSRHLCSMKSLTLFKQGTSGTLNRQGALYVI